MGCSQPPSRGASLTGHSDAVISAAFSPDGKALVTGSLDKSVRLWDLATRRLAGSPLIGHTDAVLAVAFSPDGKTLASGSWDNSVRLWNVSQLADPAAFLCKSVGQSFTRNQWSNLVPYGPQFGMGWIVAVGAVS